MARKHRLGDRRDGRKIRTLNPMDYVSPFIMTERNEANNLYASRYEISALEQYIREKRAEGWKGYGFLAAWLACFVRTVSQRPAMNRYIAGQRIFQRDDIVISMMVKKSMGRNAQETGIKLHLARTDTAKDVYEKLNAAVEEARAEGDTTSLDKVARVLVNLPALILRWFVALMKGLDYFGIMPKVIDTASPFHCSLFVTDLGSIGIGPVYHHLYNFGNCTLFMAFGLKYSEESANPDEPRKRYIDYKLVMDERITDGYYYASSFKLMERIIKDPWQLDSPPETVVEDID